MTKFTDNSQPITTSTDVIEWLQTKLGSKTPISITMNRDGTIKNLELGLSLSITQKNLVTDKYPELA
jgi:hypothetical protein